MRGSQRVFVLKTRAPQVVDLRRHVELEGIEPSTSSMPSMVRIDQQSSRKGLVLEDHADGFRIEPFRPDRVVAGRRLVDHPTPQVTLLATLQRVRPAKRLRPGEAGGDGTHDRPRHEGIRCPARIGADRLKPGGNRIELRRAGHAGSGTATSRMTVDSPGRAYYLRPPPPFRAHATETHRRGYH